MAKWTRQTYEMIAGILHIHLQEHIGHISPTSDKKNYQYNLGHVGASSRLMTLFADRLERDNPGFDRARFYEAVNTGKHIRATEWSIGLRMVEADRGGQA